MSFSQFQYIWIIPLFLKNVRGLYDVRGLYANLHMLHYKYNFIKIQIVEHPDEMCPLKWPLLLMHDSLNEMIREFGMSCNSHVLRAIRNFNLFFFIYIPMKCLRFWPCIISGTTRRRPLNVQWQPEPRALYNMYVIRFSHRSFKNA